MDNRIFNVNGHTLDQLKVALRLAAMQWSINRPDDAFSGWRVDDDYGLMLLWSVPGGQDPKGVKSSAFMARRPPEDLAVEVQGWLNSGSAEPFYDRLKRPEVEWTDKVNADPRLSWDRHYNGDGDTGKGWRVYCQNWGHVGGEQYALCAVLPVWMWYGK